jgi:hypothetical protein
LLDRNEIRRSTRNLRVGPVDAGNLREEIRDVDSPLKGGIATQNLYKLRKQLVVVSGGGRDEDELSGHPKPRPLVSPRVRDAVLDLWRNLNTSDKERDFHEVQKRVIVQDRF